MTNTDGGPAFPRPFSTDEHRDQCNHFWQQDGMSLRDWFAGMALQGLLAGRLESASPSKNSYVSMSFQFADDMLAERNKQ